MGSDRARITYDESRQYRAVVMQQGRVTVEADWNEEEQIANEEMRKAALDFVGPNGTPDNGYRVIETFTSPPEASPPEAPFDFSVDKGTMYVGGVRAFSADPIQYSQQRDWLDYLGDPDWVDLSTLANTPPQQEFIYLYLREQEVSAVEDSALREVALGGPDTAQRLRLIQHIVRQETSASTCPTALAAAQTKWVAEGLNFDDRTMRLMSATTLQVSFSDGVTAPGPCEPQAQAGYLGADNQLIRVQIASFDQHTNTYTLVWGFDNASFLYRVTVADDLRTLRLLSCPVDDLHKPRANQAVEVLRSAAQLSAITDNYVASATGFVATLEKDYASDTESITLPTPLPAEYKDASQTPVVFLRVWEEEVKPFTPGTPVVLGSTGLQVTLQTSGNEPLHVGDYWLFAARPNTAADPSASTQIFPHRYLEDGQPPDGPRLWACPLAVIEWTGGILQTVENGDCRNLFDNLVKLSKKDPRSCCNVLVNPDDLTGSITLQTIVNSFGDGDFVTVCLTHGVYALSEPLQLIPRNSNLTLESCHGGVTIQAAPGQENNFLHGLIVLNGADNVTLRGLSFEMPVVPFTQAGGTIANIEPSTLSRIAGAFLQNGLISIGIRPLDCTSLTVQDCFFHFPGGQDQFLNGFGIFAAGDCEGLTVRGNTFKCDQGFNEQTGLLGYSLDDTLQFTSGIDLTAQASNIPAGAMLPALLQDASFQDNQFSGLNGAVNIAADIGAVKIEGNTVQNCGNGFTLTAQGLTASAALVDEVSVNRGQLALAQRLRNTILDMMMDPAVQLTSVLAKGYPLPRGFDMSKAIRVTAQKNHTTTEAERRPIQTLFDRIPAVLGGSGDAAADKVIVAQGASRRSGTPFASGLERLNALLSAFERVALTQHASPAQLPFTLSMSGNDITVNPIRKGTSALQVSLFTNDLESAMTLSDNRMQQNEGDYTVYISGVSRCTMTGNLISNHSSFGGPALLVSTLEGITMSTNTLQSQGADPTINSPFASPAVQITAGPDGSTLTGNLISSDSTVVGALQVSGGILMSTNTIRGQGTEPTAQIDAGTADSTLTGNQIANNNPTNGSALVAKATSLIMSANSAQNMSTNDPTVQIAAGTANSTITGNQITNGGNGGTSLQYVELTGFNDAITGNVLRGTAVLPPRVPRPVPPGLEFLNTWVFLNNVL